MSTRNGERPRRGHASSRSGAHFHRLFLRCDARIADFFRVEWTHLDSSEVSSVTRVSGGVETGDVFHLDASPRQRVDEGDGDQPRWAAPRHPRIFQIGRPRRRFQPLTKAAIRVAGRSGQAIHTHTGDATR